ncbi:MAG: putative selenate reductase subunit YgfK [Bacteroidales bacterium]|nr:putative selenate reductase subunit YgfK [Bacteroidales bacterium]
MLSDFQIIPFREVFAKTLKDLENDHFMGIPSATFAKDRFEKTSLTRFNKTLETPIGVAAGPHSQLSHNIVAAWLCGGRYIELKTVQTLDELNVTKPCIDMQDEGYNCEWSQELKIKESFNQYLDAWIMIHVLNHKLYGKNDGGAGAIFNMSVGYNLEGILKDNVQWFFEKMNSCRPELDAKIAEISNLYPEIENLSIPDQISDNITLSTMHGCPPDEIEKIGMYLINEKKLHTVIKLNPTLLGPDKLRYILNEKLKFKTVVPEEAFRHDLKYTDALNIIRNLTSHAAHQKVHFGLKLTNTLESKNIRKRLPENEDMHYMSGRALHPISVNLAAKLQKEFKGTLDISFSAGADAFNTPEILKCGISTVTVSSDLLKPGGYAKLSQYLRKIEEQIGDSKLEDFVPQNGETRIRHLEDYASRVLENGLYEKAWRDPVIKTARPLNQFDCIHAPCQSTCPTHQDIPEYMHQVANGNFQKAFEVIMRTNPLPNTTGGVCDHECQTRCTRINYDESLAIREVKRWVADLENDESFIKALPKNGKKAAIIGAGPAGLSCAYFLLLGGFEVDIFEAKSFSGGMVADVIPKFRLQEEALNADIDRIVRLGANIQYNSPVNKEQFEALRQSHNAIFIAGGTPNSKKLGIPGDDSSGVEDPLRFLSDLKKGKSSLSGKNIFIIGGGNTAMDVARAAKRHFERDTNISIIYRRKAADMPAETEEILAAIAENIEMRELVNPVEIISENGRVKAMKLIKMEVQGIDDSGRSKVVPIAGSEFEIEADIIFPAIGQDADIDFIDWNNKGKEFATHLPIVFQGGDFRKGPANIISAIADGRKVAELILGKETHGIENRNSDINTLKIHKTRKVYSELQDENPNFSSKVIHNAEEAQKEASRCLLCDEVCDICVTVCPNLANQAYDTPIVNFELEKIIVDKDGHRIIKDQNFRITQTHQTYNIGEFCNECGNCHTFCPTSGSPYKDKPKLWLKRENFDAAPFGYHIFEENGYKQILHKSEAGISKLKSTLDGFEFSRDNIKVVLNKDFKIISTEIPDDFSGEIDLGDAVEMWVFMESNTQTT